MILAIDTAMLYATVAVIDGESVLFGEAGLERRSHVEELGPLLQRALGDRGGDLTGVVVGRGPGSFAGLRVGLAAGQTIAWSQAIPAIGVCSLDVLARAADQEFSGFVVTDARRSELYYAQYQNGRCIEGPFVAPRIQVKERVGSTEVVGDVDLLGSDDRRASGVSRVDPEALGEVARLAVASGQDSPPRPFYLRAPDVFGKPLSGKTPLGQQQPGQSGSDSR